MHGATAGRRSGSSALLRFPVAVLAAFAILLSSAAGFAQNGSQAVPLPALGADLDATSVSGLSSGAFMASQFHIAHSRIVIGAGIVAGGPYACAEDASCARQCWARSPRRSRAAC